MLSVFFINSFLTNEYQIDLLFIHDAQKFTLNVMLNEDFLFFLIKKR